MEPRSPPRQGAGGVSPEEYAVLTTKPQPSEVTTSVVSELFRLLLPRDLPDIPDIPDIPDVGSNVDR